MSKETKLEAHLRREGLSPSPSDYTITEAIGISASLVSHLTEAAEDAEDPKVFIRDRILSYHGFVPRAMRQDIVNMRLNPKGGAWQATTTIRVGHWAVSDFVLRHGNVQVQRNGDFIRLMCESCGHIMIAPQSRITPAPPWMDLSDQIKGCQLKVSRSLYNAGPGVY